MANIVKVIMLSPAVFVLAAQGQTSGKAEFEIASIKVSAPQVGFHIASDAASGGPGTADPGLFRCSKCSLATLIIKAFNLQPYQLPDRKMLSGNTYEVMAKVPAGATGEEFSVMLQNLLKERFGLAWHFQEKKMKGYHLVIVKSGLKMKESGGESAPAAGEEHRFGAGESHNHSGVIAFGTSASYRAANQTTAGLALVLCDQTGVPVDDQTGLTGTYNISLRWSGTGAAHEGNHADGGFNGGAGHAGHDGGGTAFGAGGDAGGPTLFDALQQQLGLKLVPAQEAMARLFVVDQVAQRPTEN